MRMLIVPLRWKLIVLVVAIVFVVTGAMVYLLLRSSSLPLSALFLDQRMRSLAEVSVASALLWTAIAASLATYYVRRITVPLARVLHAAAAVEAGNLDVQVPVPESDEIGVFTARFNRLVATLKVQQEENRKLVADLNRANAELTGDVRRSERLAALGTLSAGLAHELNNVLNIISGYASVIRKEAGPDHAFTNDLEMILKEGRHASDLLNRFLMFARPARLRPMDSDLAALIHNCLSVLSLPIARQKISLVTAVAAELPLSCDPVPLEHAIFNVLLNAVQAMKGGGTLSVSTTSPPGQGTRVCVEDTGCGIRPEDLPRIYDPFFTTKGPGEGTGLGLAITHRILELHGGAIEIQSEPGRGTRVELLIPAAPPTDRRTR